MAYVKYGDQNGRSHGKNRLIKTGRWSEPLFARKAWLEAGNDLNHSELPKDLSSLLWIQIFLLLPPQVKLLPVLGSSNIPHDRSISIKGWKEVSLLLGPPIFLWVIAYLIKVAHHAPSTSSIYTKPHQTLPNKMSIFYVGVTINTREKILLITHLYVNIQKILVEIHGFYFYTVFPKKELTHPKC